jgi:glutathione synthase/RimK-type ligase-like ATP-grasp enzyme
MTRAGVPMLPAVPVTSTDGALLGRFAEHLGGFPVVAKLGGERGRGVVRLDSLPALLSFADWALDQGAQPWLERYHEAPHWRAVVIGDAVVAAYTNPLNNGDFRTSASTNPDDYTTCPPPDVARVAVSAAHACEVELAGVDVLYDGKAAWVLEANFPCYFAQAEEVAGIPVSIALVDHLLAKSRRSG